LYVNRAAIRLMGARSEKDLIGKSILQFVHPSFHKTVKERVKLLYSTNKPTPPIEEKFVRTNGEIIDVEVISMPIMYNDQTAVQIAVRDISDRKKAEEQRLIQSQISESISDAVIVHG